MCTLKNVFFYLVIALIASTSVVNAQKFYNVASYYTRINLVQQSCYVGVREEITYDFTGSYSRVARGLPYSVVEDVQTSSLSAQILTPGYTVSSATLVKGDDAFFIQVSFYPPTPNYAQTSIKIALTYSASGPVAKEGKSDVVSFSFKESVDIASLNVIYIFDSALGLKESDFVPSLSNAVVYGNSVSFTQSGQYANTEYLPSVSFTPVASYEKCNLAPQTGSNTVWIVILVVAIVGVVCLVMSCSIVGFVKRRIRYGYQPAAYVSAPVYGTPTYTPAYTPPIIVDYTPVHHHGHHHQTEYYTNTTPSGNYNSGHHSTGLTGSSGFAD